MRKRNEKSAGELGAIERIVRGACCVLVLFIVLADGFLAGSNPVIRTKWGPIRGKWSTSTNGRPIANFLGIPYALPPVGDLRFKSPQRWNHTWKTTRDATVDGKICTQLLYSKVIGDEDCLYLNVFVPMIPGNRQEKLSVIVFVHGGTFITGSSNSKLYEPSYLLDHDVVLVTMNYRLNVLGFFSTTNRVAPGNYGIKDVVAALKWVQENIHNFNGNPESVTLMGLSAGAVLVHLLALSNKTEGLFHRYILHSGTALCPWGYRYKKPYRQNCLELARLVGCLPNATASNEMIAVADSEEKNRQSGDVYNASGDDETEKDEEMMKCMRTVNTSKMLEMAQEIKKTITFLTPTLEEESDDAIVTMNPFKVVRDGLFRDIPAIVEIVQDEGLTSMYFFGKPNNVSEIVENLGKHMLFSVYCDMFSNISIFIDAIEDYYLGGNLTESAFFRNVTNIFGDGWITWPSFWTLQHQAKMGKASIYFSLFAYHGTFSLTFETGSTTRYGVCHGDDINYLFPVLNNMFADQMLHNTENDRTMISIMTEMWTNFAKYGIPSAWMIPAWPNYRDHHQFMKFGTDMSPDIAVQADFLPARMKFWENLMANLSTECDVESDVFAADPSKHMTAFADSIDHSLTFDLATLAIAFVDAFI